MTTSQEDQKTHMQSLFNQARELNAEVSQLQQKLQFKRDVLLKVQGAIEYLQQVGVPLPELKEGETESSEEPQADPQAVAEALS